jgi:hypothetical protein
MVNNSVDVVVDAEGYGVLYVVVATSQRGEHNSSDAFVTEERALLFAGECVMRGYRVHLEKMRLHRSGCV